MCKEIYLDAPSIGDLEKKYINEAIDDGYISSIGAYVSEFEEQCADYLKVKKAVSVQSGTAALHIALYELGIGEGDEVIVPALTFVATVNPVMYVGARPIFADVDIESWNIEPEDIKKKISEKTKAIIPVHFYGNPCDMGEILEIAKRNHLFVIEDAAESLGAQYKGRYTGTFSDLGCFSFNGNKIITTGGGGLVVGNDERRLEHIKFLVNQAREQSKGYFHPEIGFNYRMTNIEAALGLAQMEKLDEFLAKKKRFNEIYREELRDISCIKFQESYEGSESSWWMTAIIFDEDIDMRLLQENLLAKAIPTRRIFMPVVDFPPYKIFKKDGCPNSYDIYEKGLCLPSSARNSIESIRHICKVLKSNLVCKRNMIL